MPLVILAADPRASPSDGKRPFSPRMAAPSPVKSTRLWELPITPREQWADDTDVEVCQCCKETAFGLLVRR